LRYGLDFQPEIDYVFIQPATDYSLFGKPLEWTAFPRFVLADRRCGHFGEWPPGTAGHASRIPIAKQWKGCNMERIHFIEIKGKKILIEDFSGLKPGEEFNRTLETARQIIASQPPKSVLALFDATDAYFDKDSLSALGDFVKQNTPFVKFSCAIGIKGLLVVALQAVTRLGGRSFKIFSTKEEAIEHLTSLE
jgi:hypothetical protein